MSPRGAVLLPESVAAALLLLLLAPDLPMPLEPLSAVEGWLDGPPGWAVFSADSGAELDLAGGTAGALRSFGAAVLPEGTPDWVDCAIVSGDELGELGWGACAIVSADELGGLLPYCCATATPAVAMTAAAIMVFTASFIRSSS